MNDGLAANVRCADEVRAQKEMARGALAELEAEWAVRLERLRLEADEKAQQEEEERLQREADKKAQKEEKQRLHEEEERLRQVRQKAEEKAAVEAATKAAAAQATAEAEDEELLEDVTHRQQTAPPNTTPNTGVPGAPAAGAAGDALNTTRMAPALRTVPSAGIEAERDWLRSLPVLPSLPSQPTLAEARRVKTERPLPPVERASEEDPSVLRF